MRFLIILALVACMAISFVTSRPSEDNDENSSTDSGEPGDSVVISPRPWPKWWGIGPVITHPHDLTTE
ncbi:hypothetical protein KR074_011254 [Drosophila pseudoananassae]|nr:hypothetical protein KR074_011254 [Drosophila pseudoananassae]